MSKQKGFKKINTASVLAASLVVFSPAVLAQEATGVQSIKEAVTEGKIGLDLRYRYEFVDQDGIDKNAGASTLRSRLNFATAPYQGVGVFVEFDNVTSIGSERYNDGSGLPSANTQYPVVVDPEGTEVNQAYVSYAGVPDSVLKFGRQRIIYDNARFIGNVGWRQNEQTYDGFSLTNTSLIDTTLNYAYVYNVNRIFGEDSPKGDIETDTHLANLSYAGFDWIKVTGYGYFLDFDDTPAGSNKTLGLRLAGEPVLSASSTLVYTLEYAKQTDYADGKNIDADYQLAELGINFSGVQLLGGYELLGSGESAFQTPYATGHAFNGWADKFLATPADGLEDLYLQVGGALAGIKLQAVYHEFSADQGGADYGSELDLLAAKKFGDVTLLAKYAQYNADDFATDTDKFWLMAQVAF